MRFILLLFSQANYYTLNHNTCSRLLLKRIPVSIQELDSSQFIYSLLHYPNWFPDKTKNVIYWRISENITKN